MSSAKDSLWLSLEKKSTSFLPLKAASFESLHRLTGEENSSYLWCLTGGPASKQAVLLTGRSYL